MEEPAAPRLHRGAHLEAAAREDLDAYGVAELQARIDLLQGEITRTGAALRLQAAVPDGDRVKDRLMAGDGSWW
jgi:uncharacterized small protein (DUF1192 family)